MIECCSSNALLYTVATIFKYKVVQHEISALIFYYIDIFMHIG